MSIQENDERRMQKAEKSPNSEISTTYAKGLRLDFSTFEMGREMLDAKRIRLVESYPEPDRAHRRKLAIDNRCARTSPLLLWRSC